MSGKLRDSRMCAQLAGRMLAMPDEGRDDLSTLLRDQREAVERTVVDAITGLQQTAGLLSLRETETRLDNAAEQLASETFKIIVMGRFKNGKSTLLNALMGGTTRPVAMDGAGGPMVVDDLPATAVLSEVNYADDPFIKVRKMDGTTQDWTLEEYLHKSRLTDDELSNTERFKEVAEFELGFPARLCKSNVTLYDSPGLDESAIRSRITREAWRRCDSAIFVYGSGALMGESELADDDRVRSDGTHVFAVVNLFDGRHADDRLRGYVWNKYVRDQLHGPAWAGQDLADYDIFFVNAKLASDARYKLNGAAADRAYRDSGLAAFEQRLSQFLTEERLQVHLTAFTRRAINAADALTQHISQRQAAVAADRDRLQAQWAAAQPRVSALRSTTDQIAKIVDHYRAGAIEELTSSFAILVARIRRDLPAHLEGAALPTASAKMFAVWHQKKLMEEAVDEINSFITERISDWNEREAQEYMGSIARQLAEEIADEVATIDRQFDIINMELTGWDSAAFGTPGNVHSTTERIGAAIAGLLLGDVSASVAGGRGGWRGAAGGIGGALGASWMLMGVLGITSTLVLAPILAVAALAAAISGSAGLVGRIKRKAADAADEKLVLLPGEVSATLTSDLTRRFQELGLQLVREVAAHIGEETRNLEEQVDLSRREDTASEHASRDLEKAAADVKKYREILQYALTDAAEG
jgi:hypothetical protein